MLLEARAAHLRILQVKHQKRAVQKGAKALEELLTLIKDEGGLKPNQILKNVWIPLWSQSTLAILQKQ